MPGLAVIAPVGALAAVVEPGRLLVGERALLRAPLLPAFALGLPSLLCVLVSHVVTVGSCCDNLRSTLAGSLSRPDAQEALDLSIQTHVTETDQLAHDRFGYSSAVRYGDVV